MNLEELVKKFISDVNALGGAGLPPDATVDQKPTAVVYESSGWSLVNRSRFGAPRSKRVDDLVKELAAKGYTEIANKIPTYHGIAFWLNEPLPATINLNTNKVKSALNNFGTFAPLLSDFEEQQLSDNIYNALMFRVPFWLQSATDPAPGEYRGEKDKQGFVKVVETDMGPRPDFSPSLPPDYQSLASRGYIQRPGEVYFQEFNRTYDSTWAADYKAEPVPGSHQKDHCVYNPWWHGKTDENVGRYWRNWAISVGADIRPA